jgi:hypothetical protein
MFKGFTNLLVKIIIYISVYFNNEQHSIVLINNISTNKSAMCSLHQQTKPVTYSSSSISKAAINIPFPHLIELYAVITRGLLHVIHCLVVRGNNSKGDVNKHWKENTKVCKKQTFRNCNLISGLWTKDLDISLEPSVFRHHKCS